jgi:bifunctional DNase/RNase
MTLMTVTGLLPDPKGDDAVLVLQTLPGDRILGLLVPMSEATRLARVLGPAACGCSPIYDLLVALSEAVKVSVSRAVLDLSPGGIGARLIFALNGTETPFDCHPADAVALAVRMGAAIYATSEALDRACPASAHGHVAADEATADWLERVRPADFGSPPAQPEGS